MMILFKVLRALARLFFDDVVLAPGALACVGLTALLIDVGAPPLAGGAVLLCGSLLVLVVGAVRGRALAHENPRGRPWRWGDAARQRPKPPNSTDASPR